MHDGKKTQSSLLELSIQLSQPKEHYHEWTLTLQTVFVTDYFISSYKVIANKLFDSMWAK